MAMNFAQDQSGMDGSFASPAQPRQSFGGKPFSGRGGQPMPVSGPNYLNQAPYGGQGRLPQMNNMMMRQPPQSQPMFTGTPIGGGGPLGQLIGPPPPPPPPQQQATAGMPQTGIQPMESQQMMTGAPTGGGGALGQLANPQAQQIQDPANAQRVAGMLRGAGRLFGGL